MAGKTFGVMQLPLTLPTLDEMAGLEGDDPLVLAGYFAGLLGEAMAHAEALWRLERALREESPRR